MKAKPATRTERVVLVLFLALLLWVVANYGSHNQVVLANEPPPPWWNPYAPAPMDDPSVVGNPGTYVSPYGVVIRYNVHKAKQFADTVARLYSEGYEITTSGRLGSQAAVFMSGVMDWGYAAGMATNTINGFAAAAGPPAAVARCAYDLCCFNPSACETVYQ